MKKYKATWAVLIILTVSISTFFMWNWDKFYRVKDVELRELNCAEKGTMLQEVYESDRRVRSQNVPFKELVAVDHENLEIVISILEYCGVPTLEDVSEEQLGAVWLVLQHTVYPKYRKQYFKQIEESVNRGDLSKEQYALMKDRIMVDEGKPQIYGSQFSDGEVYQLFEPEYVDQRREEMGMEPINEYLKKVGIEFSVAQKRKKTNTINGDTGQ